MRLITDVFAFCADEVPQMEHDLGERVSHPRGGLDRVQELAFTLRDGIEYVQWGVDAGLDVDDFVPRMSFFFNAHSDFFEEIAKYRAARRIWAHAHARPVRREERAVVEAALPHARRPACRSPRSSRTTTSSGRRCRRCRRCSAAPTRCTPTRSTRRWRCRPRSAATLALRTQQIIAHESGVAERRRSASAARISSSG